ncbi:MAG: homocysteine S-methyltransferase family protein [Candidatus Heimdallarchaeota archaeon]|nr:homocysteine S-methyltransferase family protein [Candidatus Heimdallarchaeota archaeon]
MKVKQSILDLIKNRIVILDGAMGSLLIDEGLPAGLPPENWNITHPEIIQKIQKSYYDAGSDAVLTNTFGGSRIKLAALKHGEKVEEYNTAAVENARAICPEGRLIAGDIGPSGIFLPPIGNATEDILLENFFEQAKILAENEVDFFFIETMMDLQEAELAVQAVKKVTNLPIIASITYQKTKRGFFTIMGNTVVDCSTRLAKAGANIIGANCTITSEEMVDLVPTLKEATSLPISVKPNAGKPELRDGKIYYPTTTENFAKNILKMVQEKVSIVGGCCGTNPQFIKKIIEKIKANNI